MSASRAGDGALDVAIVGAGAAGTYIGHRLLQARPDWRIAIFERSERIGGRLWSVKVDGLAKPIELGGMRFMTGHRLVDGVVTELGIETRDFDPGAEPERMVLRGVLARTGGGDPAASSGYDLPVDERGRSPDDLMESAFRSIVPEMHELDDAGWRRLRATATFGDRRLIDWSIGDALASVLSPEGHRLVGDAFGYSSGIGPHNAADAIQYIFGTGHPSGRARVPVDGMDAIPRWLAEAFTARGGAVELGRDVRRVEAAEGLIALAFADGSGVRARRLVLTTPLPALERLAGESPVINGQTWRRLYGSVQGFTATKLYCWYDRPWWRDGADAPTGIRTTTDLPNRKTFYFDEGAGRPASIIASFTDHRHDDPIMALAGDRSRGEPATPPLLDAIRGWLSTAHPGADVPARPVGSAMQHWGADPQEVGYHFWRAGANSDDMMDLAAQPHSELPIHIAGEVFCRAGAWVEGALMSAERTLDAILGVHRSATSRSR